MTNNKLYARDEYLKKKAADSNGLNIQLTNNYAFRKTCYCLWVLLYFVINRFLFLFRTTVQKQYPMSPVQE